MSDTAARADIDTAELESFLSTALEGTVTDLEVLHDGLNLSIAVSTAETDRAFVVRRPNKFRQRESFNDVRQEYRVLRTIRGTDVPAPEPVLWCEDDSVLGEPFLVMTHLEGESVPLGADLPERFRNPAARERFATGVIETMADLHPAPVDPFTGVCDRRPLREQVDGIVDQFEDATSVTGRENRSLRRVADWLRENVPAKSPTTLVHGDYRPANVLFAGADRPEVTGVLDWEAAFLGDPLTELGYLLLRWRDDGDPTPSLADLDDRCANEAALEELREINERGLAPYTNDPGSPSRRDVVSRYEAETGFEFENERFYRAFAAFILAAIWEDLHRHRVEAGAESNREPYIDYVSMIATSIIDGEFRL